ncbi:hypothetical protein ABMA28_011763 [Loxostege sticticalis]|uniref:Uncharacterized protein n=1 Tax=Loxostege sticticalis TaxID=481309 RepID=A0ABD0TKE8_LOXSC
MSDRKSVLFCEESEDLSTLMDSSDDTELVELCEIAECVECALEFFKEDSQIGRGIKRTHDNPDQNGEKRRRLRKPSTSRAPEQIHTPPSPDQNVMIECEVCKIPVKKRYLASHYRSTIHKNNAFRIHHSFPNVTLLETAFGKRIHTFRIKPISDNSIAKLKKYKANFIHQSKKLTNTFDFQTSNFIINESEDLTRFIGTLHETSLKNIISLDMNVYKFNPLRGSSYIDLHRIIRNNKAVINWALLSALYPAEKSSDRVTSYSTYEHELNYTGISFPMHNLSINVFGLEYNAVSKTNTIIFHKISLSCPYKFIISYKWK